VFFFVYLVVNNMVNGMRIVFFGTPEFAAKVLSFLLENGVEVAAVITKPDRPKGRSGAPVPTPVKAAVQQLRPDIPVFQPEIVSDPAFSPTIEAFKADLFVVVAYGEIIKQHLLDMPRLGCINLHASLLPKYRGAAPIQRSIINGEPVTGVTIMHMVKKMDAGDIIKMVEVPIGPNDSFPEIEQRLCDAGSQALLDVIREFASGVIRRIPQDHAQATLAPKIELEDCELKWSLPAGVLHNLVRGVVPDPGAWCYVTVRGQKKRLKIYSTNVVEGTGPFGSILSYGKDGLVVACGQGALHILHVQLEGKKAMSADELLRGIPRDQLVFS
jgi:methionyl-tRNA formyltransferase